MTRTGDPHVSPPDLLRMTRTGDPHVSPPDFLRMTATGEPGVQSDRTDMNDKI
ncbi:MAG: hypothetical protein II989_03180 [Bacteroidales bacterium]|nr:hypothetical protein [Bacteroidales bacterium]